MENNILIFYEIGQETVIDHANGELVGISYIVGYLEIVYISKWALDLEMLPQFSRLIGLHT